MTCFQPFELANCCNMPASKRCRHWIQTSFLHGLPPQAVVSEAGSPLINESICWEKSSEKSTLYDPDVFAEVAPAGTAKCSEPPPEAYVVVSMVGVVKPEAIKGSPGAAFPLMVDAVSNVTQRITPAAAQRAWKSASAFEVEFDTVTLTPAAVAVFPAESVAVAESVCVPLLAPAVFHDKLYGEAVSAEPSEAPSSKNCTLAIGLVPAVAEAVAVTVPVSDAPLAGEEMEIDGGVTGAEVFSVPNVYPLLLIVFPLPSTDCTV